MSYFKFLRRNSIEVKEEKHEKTSDIEAIQEEKTENVPVIETAEEKKDTKRKRVAKKK